jgi:hypothetical protein
MKAVSLVYEIVGTLKLDESGVIKISEFETELGKYGLFLDDLESGLIMYHIIKHILIYKDEVILDFEDILDVPYIFVYESIARLSCEYGEKIHDIVKVINVNRRYQSFVNMCMAYYTNTLVNTLYTYTDTNTPVDMAVA